MKHLKSAFIVALSFFTFLSMQTIYDYFKPNEVVAKEPEDFAFYEKQLTSLKVKTVEGKTLDFAKEKFPIVIINFWATWCAPCLEEFPSLVELKKKYSNQIAIVGINQDLPETIANVKKIRDRFKVNFDIVYDEKFKISEAFKFDTVPISLIYQNGKLLEINRGAKNFMDSSFTDKIDEIITKKTKN
ncbi:MAG: TlpA disulfide reductase family protein [Bacteriovoracaceae bacterium]